MHIIILINRFSHQVDKLAGLEYHLNAIKLNVLDREYKYENQGNVDRYLYF